MALPEKRRGGVPAERINNSGFYRFPLPCFATGCHTFGLKIATAAQRPRNDTNLERFYLGNGRFFALCGLLARCCPASFFKHFVQKTVPFSRKTYQICHCEEDTCARRGNLKRNDLSSRNEIWLDGTKQNLEIKKEKAKRSSESHVFCDRAAVLFRTPVLCCGMPYLWLKDCHVAALLAMTQIETLLFEKQTFLAVCRRFRAESTSRFCPNLAMTQKR